MHCHSRFYAASNFTTPTTSTLETGLLPWTHQANQISSKVAPALRDHTLAQQLSAAGYRTFQTTDNHLASPRHRATHSGYEQSDITPSALWRDQLRAMLTRWPESSLPTLVDSSLSFLGAFDKQIHATENPFASERVLRQVQPWLEQSGSREAPKFVWVHAMPPHGPYLPPPSTKYRLLPPGQLDRWSQFLDENTPYSPKQQGVIDLHRLLYQESVMATDLALIDVLNSLERSGRLQNAILVLTADHGESFERGFFGHAGPMLHEALVHIPFAIRLPGQKTGHIWEAPASQADIAPSLLALLKLPALPRADGESLAPLWLGDALEETRPVFSMALERQSRFAPFRQGHVAVTEGAYKLHLNLGTGARQLYRLQEDPAESNDIGPQQASLADRLEQLIRQRVAKAEQARISGWH